MNEVPFMKVVVESFGNVGSRARIGEHELVFDQPVAVPGGQDLGPCPLDVMSVSVGACTHYMAAAYLRARGFPPQGLTVQVTAEQEQRTPVKRIGRLSISVRLPAGLSGPHIAGIKMAIERCPAYATLLHPPPVEISIEAEAASGPKTA
jgi:uncharacterized OsmC-like protein